MLLWLLETSSGWEFDVFIFSPVFWVILRTVGRCIKGLCSLTNEVGVGAELSSQGAGVMALGVLRQWCPGRPQSSGAARWSLSKWAHTWKSLGEASALNVPYKAPGIRSGLLDFKFTEENNGKEARAPTGHVEALNERRRWTRPGLQKKVLRLWDILSTH